MTFAPLMKSAVVLRKGSFYREEKVHDGIAGHRPAKAEDCLGRGMGAGLALLRQ